MIDACDSSTSTWSRNDQDDHVRRRRAADSVHRGSVSVDLERLRVSADRRDPQSTPVDFKSRFLPPDDELRAGQQEVEAALLSTGRFQPGVGSRPGNSSAPETQPRDLRPKRDSWTIQTGQGIRGRGFLRIPGDRNSGRLPEEDARCGRALRLAADPYEGRVRIRGRGSSMKIGSSETIVHGLIRCHRRTEFGILNNSSEAVTHDLI